MFKTIEWTPEGVRMIDQTRLPSEEVYLTCHNYREVAEAIRRMVIRGAPAIGVAAAMGIALGIMDSPAHTVAELRAEFETIAQVISQTRPTAVNLFGLSSECERFLKRFWLRKPAMRKRFTRLSLILPKRPNAYWLKTLPPMNSWVGMEPRFSKTP